ncbi:MAG: asparagine synthase (glutamine-hydrolyzing) [Nitrososphaerales archaeon]|jgi:asparagine synthase (glutamine-hydrolysing)|nr:asparagine synthase (glutamine-hydrolyzing) [Nitrososphaerales archaeon]|tara:strand:- start:8953 stop:10845 length:1893 start_codon:yes stop_codon:yes gene_type:complete
MCGIVGTLGGNTDLVESASAVIKHRGPDDSGVFVDKSLNIGLGHQRLSILDISTLGHQPMFSSNRKVVIVFNGEIYNFRELRAQLEEEGCIFHGNSDTEVLLNLYLSEGKVMLSKLNGIFAFAIWDSDSESLFVARDALGVKPIYYSVEGGIFAFASEIKALLELTHHNKSLNPEAINRYLSFLWCPGKETPLKLVQKLLPGEAIIVKKGKIEEKWLWYQLPMFRGVRSNLNKKDAISGTVDHLRQAVHRQMVSDVPLGAFLSGGLDSSAVVAFARELNPNIRCFSIETKGGQDPGFVDDLPYARKVAKHLNVPLEVVSVDSRKIAEDLEYMVTQLDEPLADPASLNVLYISQLAKEHDIKVLLSGTGGDDLFTGYRRHYAIQLERYWNWLPYQIRSLIENTTHHLNTKQPFQRRLAKLFNGAGLDSNERLINYFRWSSDSLLQSLYSKEFRELLGNSDSSSPMKDFIAPLSSNSSQLDLMLSLEQRFFLADHNLNYTDKMSMAAGVEVRVPFLDVDLVDFASRIPNRYKQYGREGKWVLKKAMQPYLPKSVIYRPKSGFGVPLRRWMKEDLRELLGDLLSVDSLNKRGVFSVQAVQELISDNDNGKIDASYTLLSILCVEIWCRAYIDN